MVKDSLKRKDYGEVSHTPNTEFKAETRQKPVSLMSEEENNIAENDYINELTDAVREEFMSLGKVKANKAAYHYIQVFLYLDENPKLAFKEAEKLVNISSRIGTFRELYGVTAYYCGKYDIALKELKTARRINGSNEYIPIIADSYRGLDQPEKVIELAKEDYIHELPTECHAELAIVLAGAFFDKGDTNKAQTVLKHELTNKLLSQSISFRIMDASMHFYEESGDKVHANEYHEQLDPIRGEIGKETGQRYIALDLLEKE